MHHESYFNANSPMGTLQVAGGRRRPQNQFENTVCTLPHDGARELVLLYNTVWDSTATGRRPFHRDMVPWVDPALGQKAINAAKRDRGIGLIEDERQTLVVASRPPTSDCVHSDACVSEKHVKMAMGADPMR